MAHWVGTQGQINLAKKTQITPTLTSSRENPNKKFFFQSKLEDFPNP